MRSLITIFLFTITLVVIKAQPDARWKFETIKAPSLENNILNEIAQREIVVYLPPEYYNSDKKYPVLYYLMGYNGSGKIPYREILEHNKLIDRKIRSNQINELIVVFINGSNKFRGSFYVNSPVTGNWKDFITQDVVKYIDTTYRTLNKRESRSIVGNSMGGFGALNICMLHPDIYCAGYGISPGLYAAEGFNNSQFVKRKGIIEQTNSLIKKFNSLPKEVAKAEFLNFIDTCQNKRMFVTMSYGAAFAPDTKKAPFFKFPFKIVGNDTIIDKQLWELWQNGFGGIENEIKAYKSNLEQLKLIGMAVGYNEGYKWLYNGTVFYSNKLAENAITHNLYLHQGTHTSHTISVFMDNVLPLVSNIMEQ